MKKLLTFCFLMLAVTANAQQSTNRWRIVRYDLPEGALTFQQTNGTFTLVIPISDLVVSNSAALPKIEKFIYNAAQPFTAAAGYEPVTNLSTSVTAGNFTTTDSNVTINVTADYTILVSASWESSAVNTLFDGHIHTNGVEVQRIGWSRKIAVAGDQGSAAGGGIINITAGTVVDLRMDVDKNTTATFDHFSMMIIGL